MFLLHSLRPRPGGFAPPEVLDRLRAGLFQEVQARARLTQELLKVLRRFRGAGIGALAYKGPALSQFLYGDPTVRCFSDLDLVVRPSDFEAARRILRKEGYRSICDSLTPSRRGAALRSFCSDQFTRSQEGGRLLWVELHWELTPGFFRVAVRPEELWAAAQRVTVQGEEVLIHGTEDLLLLLCVHGGKHLWERLWWLCDVAEMVRAHPELDWKAMEGRAQVLGIRRVFFLGLRLASDLLGLDLPEGIRSRVLSDRESGLLAERIQRRFLKTEGDSNGRREFHRFYWKMRERWWDRCRDRLGHAGCLLTPTSLEWERWPLPDALFFLYYLLRPLRLMGKYGQKFFNGLFV